MTGRAAPSRRASALLKPAQIKRAAPGEADQGAPVWLLIGKLDRAVGFYVEIVTKAPDRAGADLGLPVETVERITAFCE
jgi:hypothetical protein